MQQFETEIYLRYKQIIQDSVILDPGVQRTIGEGIHATSCRRSREDGNPSSSVSKPRSVTLPEIIDRYDAFCFDGYGTLYNRGSFVYPGAMEWFKMLRRAGKHLRLVTNAASDIDEVLARDADKRGFDFSTEETISSGSLLRELVESLRRGESAAHSGAATFSRTATKPHELREIYYIGRETGKHVLEACGITAVAMDAEPAEPIVAISSAKDMPETYVQAVKILRKPGAILLVLNSDAWAPKIPDENGVTIREPVSGALSERLRRDSMCDANGGEGCETFYLGKPFPQIWDKVKRSLPSGSRVLMIGDTLGTDVYGAKIAGFDSALVVGRNVPAEELEADETVLCIRPDWYLV
ncbi:MAG: HAD family hydrolase [Fibrobacter sp.]|uniref:HAD-IIA family hydrolase n=1 Tax=Fibrobacter sp. TaxID=35828 RepID=UPI0025BC1EDE|nr:HAD family hydrolase [Fibrobacter sp.]MBQ7081807.1 HAD family hydrolase [Fibrobacter sp.]